MIRGAVFLVGLLAVVLPRTAEAYCRTTSCQLGETAERPCARDAAGVCVVEGEPTYWSSNCLDYALQVDGSPKSNLDADQLLPLFEAAFALWKSADCGAGQHPHFEATFQGFVSCDRQQAVCGDASQNVNTFMFQDASWPSPLPSNAAAVTNPIGSVESGRLIDADIQFNSYGFSFHPDDPGALDLSRVIAHELGHFLGLSHSDEAGALMSINYQDLAAGGQLLTADDAAAICAVFPPAPETLSCQAQAPATDACAEEEIGPGSRCSLPVAPAAGGCSLGTTRPVGASAAALPTGFGLALLLLLRRRRRLEARRADSW